MFRMSNPYTGAVRGAGGLQPYHIRGYRGRGRGQGFRPHFFRKKPYEELEKLLTKTPNEVLFALKNDAYGFKDLITSKILELSKIRVSVQLLSLACHSNHIETLRDFLRDLMNSFGSDYLKVTLVNYLTSFVNDQAGAGAVGQCGADDEFLDCLLNFLNALLNWHPQRSLCYIEVLANLVERVLGNCQVVNVDLAVRVQEMLENVAMLKNQVTIVQPVGNSKSFRTIPIFPTVREISMHRRPFLKKNLISGSYLSVDEYLDTQYRLLREDFVRPLREGIASYLEHFRIGSNGRVQDIKVYHNVTIKNALVSNEGVLYQVHFDFASNPNLRNIRWEATKRLIYGNLVCLSFDSFQTLYFGTVGSRDPLSMRNGIVQVKFENCNDILRMKYRNFTMVETDAYFEAFRYVLTALQNIDESTFPLKEHIVHVQKEVSHPKYINQDTVYCFKYLTKEHKESLKCDVESRDPVPSDTISCVCKDTVGELPVKLLKDETWPSAETLNLDESQKEALKMALTKKVAIIQGPPGTGKTFVGLKIMEALLHNQNHWKGPQPEEAPSPIVVVCYTNHALDQFLEGVLELTDKIVRVGGRSTSKKLQPYCMAQLKRNRNRNHRGQYMAGHFQKMKKDLEDTLREINEKDRQLKNSGNIILSEETLKPVIDPDQYASLTQDPPAYLNLSNVSRMLPYWLGIQLPPHVLNCHIEDDEKTWIVENETTPKKKSPSKVFNPRNIEPKTYEVKEYTNVFCANQRDRLDREKKRGNQDNQVADPSEAQVPKRDASATEHFDTKEVDRIIAQRQDTPDEGEVSVICLDEQEEADEFFQRLGCHDADFKTVGGKELKRERKLIATNLKECRILTDQEMEELKKKSVWNLRNEDKWRLYKTWHFLYNKHVRQELEELRKEYERKLKAFNEIRTEEELVIARNALVIGLTTSGAAKYRHFVQNLRSKIVIVEEAAEVLEAQVVTSLSKYTEHLILIGDHQQLRPNPVVFELAMHYHLDVSLFERLIKNDLPYVTLGIQHRMRPCISKLLVPTIYNELQDHEIVMKYEDVKGFKKNMFFVNHESHEVRPEHDSTSRVNMHEAEFIVALCHYVLKQGYKQSQVTILTTYQGQLSTIRRLMPKHWENVQATVVDNYQGEENDIILMSFVRSNETGVIGFLKTANRVCVALSRAKKGLYCIGNFNLLARHSELWEKITTHLRETESIGTNLELVCQLHNRVTLVSKADHFKNVPDGGCLEKCNVILNCGHKCNRNCHPVDQEHLEIECPKPCEKLLNCKHKCVKLCYQECGDCKVLVPKMMDNCGHKIMVPCCEKDTDDLSCDMPCLMHKNCGHPCSGKCGQPCKQCSVQVKVMLASCGHEVLTTCHQKDLEVCQERCRKVLPCGHRCLYSCGEICGPCRIKVKTVGVCFHAVEIQCKDKTNREELRKVCQEKCNLLLPCNHLCKNRCGQPCSTFCDEDVVVTPACGHPFKTQCNLVATIDIPALMESCEGRCLSTLECGHICGGTCSQCFRGRLHVPCRSKCERFLVCGHVCQDICSASCPPCRQICQNRCAHTYCQQMCGYPCIPCQESCESRCIHGACPNTCDSLCDRPPCSRDCDKILPCGHNCLGICGELCPFLCRICHKNYVSEFGDNLKFLQLEDCGHIFETNEIATYLQCQMTSAIYVFRCPCCYTPIRRSNYFRHFIKMANLGIEKFKLKYFSIYEHTAEPQTNLRIKLDELVTRKPISKWSYVIVTSMLRFLEPGYLISHAILYTFINNVEILQALLKIENDLRSFDPNSQTDPGFGKILIEVRKYFDTFVGIVASRMTNTAFSGSLQISNDLLKENSRLRCAMRFLKTYANIYAQQSDEFKKCYQDMFSVLLFQEHDEMTCNEILAGLKRKLLEILGFEPVMEMESEMIQLVEPMAYAAGKWYTCPNGHVNCIPSGLLEQGICPNCVECNLPIT